MGAVDRVLDERTGRVLALKQLRVDEQAGEEADSERALLCALFEREFYTLTELAHPSRSARR
jgi:hypothetical protein